MAPGGRMFVVTGGPGSGKTSLLSALAERGVAHMPEAGRAIIREQVAAGGTALPWADRMAFAERMLERDILSHRRASAMAGPVMMDRGVPDVVGYLILCGLPVPGRFRRVAESHRYDPRVFVAPYWDAIFTRDAERKQDRAEAEATCEVMERTCSRLGYEPILLPFAGIAERAAFVLDHIQT